MYNDENYDLAILRFISKDRDYFVPKLSKTDPTEDTPIISIGSPNGLINAITLGSVGKYESISAVDKDSNLSEVGNKIAFDVMSHDAKIDAGSSGGAIFNYQYEICGINFASGVNSNKEFVSGYAIQPSKIFEFLSIAQFEI